VQRYAFFCIYAKKYGSKIHFYKMLNMNELEGFLEIPWFKNDIDKTIVI